MFTVGVMMNYNGYFKTCQEQLGQQGRRAMYSKMSKIRSTNNWSATGAVWCNGATCYNGWLWGLGLQRYQGQENVHVTFVKHWWLNVRKTTCIWWVRQLSCKCSHKNKNVELLPIGLDH